MAKGKGEPVDALMAEGCGSRGLAEDGARALAAELDAELTRRLEVLPNLPFERMLPDGTDETGQLSELRPASATSAISVFRPRTIVALGEATGGDGFRRGGEDPPARAFVFLKAASGEALERALAQFMLDLHTTEGGYTEVNPPFLVKDNAGLRPFGQLAEVSPRTMFPHRRTASG